MGTLLGLIGGIIQLLGLFLFQYFGWVLVVAVFSYLIWQNRMRAKWFASTDFELIKIEIAEISKTNSETAEKLLTALHSIYKPGKYKLFPGSIQEHISLELNAHNGQVNYYMWMPKYLHDLVVKHINAQYQHANITVLKKDYLPTKNNATFVSGWELGLRNDSVLPLQTFTKIKGSTMPAISGVLEQANKSHESLSLQLLIQPVGEGWTKRASGVMGRIKSRGIPQQWSGKFFDMPRFVLGNFLTAFWRPPSNQLGSKTAPTDKAQEEQINAIKTKIAKPAYKTLIRALYTGKDDVNGDANLKALFGSFNQFAGSNNSLIIRNKLNGDDAFDFYRARYLSNSRDILNTEELASMYNLARSSHKQTRVEKSEKSEEQLSAPDSTPEASLQSLLPDSLTKAASPSISLFGSLKHDGKFIKFGLSRADRSRHLYVIGQSGTGKSFLLKLLAISDIHYGHGLGIIDAHGNFVKSLIEYIPKKRQKDIIYIDSAQDGIGFNPLSEIMPDLRAQVTSDIVEALGRLFPKGLNDHTEYILRYCVLALAETPGTWLGDIIRLLQDSEYRQGIISNLTDPVTHTFWSKQYESWAERHMSQAINPITNKIGEFVNNPRMVELLRPKENLDLDQIIYKHKILLVNLSRGKIGDENSGAFGALILSQLRRAALAQKSTTPFYLYVDNFQNYATPSFADLLAEAHSIGLNITLTNQYVEQMPESVREAVFGTVGSVVSFRLSPSDAGYLAPYFSPNFTAHDLINLHDRHFIACLNANGVRVPSLRATTLSLPEPPK